MNTETTERQFQAGDVVLLKSGSPLMTLEELLPNKRWACAWINKETNAPFFATFLPQTLVHVQKKPAY